jgi:hypothetical protein
MLSRVMLVVAFMGPLALGQEVNFARDVLPILSENCFHCHGPDASKRSAGLRLDTKDGAFRTKNGVTTIVPGKSAESEIIRRMLSADADEVMPPPDSNRKLTAKQIATLKTWVDQGAKWGQHWAFEPLPKSIPVPASKTHTSSIDRFLADRLTKEGLAFQPAAPPEAWLRRVTLDLTGLPPTAAELDAFLRDPSAEAKAKVVDRLFASPRYGERMASDWLDIARYADTHGYQFDRFREMYPYRDWVIRAFQSNQKYDQFLTEQLAGDLLPKPTKQQRLATAFNRLHMQNEEGGIVEEEFRVAYVADRVNTMGTAFLAMTFECTRCHDHKYDPLTQKDYYSLYSFFQNIDESGQTVYFTSAMPVPALPLSTDDQDQKIETLRKAIRDKETKLEAVLREASEKTKVTSGGVFPEKLPGLQAAFNFDDWKGGKAENRVDPKKPGNNDDGAKPTAGVKGQGATMTGDNGFSFPGLGHFTRDDAFSFSIWLKVPKHLPRMVVLHHSRAPIDAGSRGYDMLLEDGHVAFGLYYMWPGNALKARTKAAIPTNNWVHVGVSYDGSSQAKGLQFYINGERAEVDIVRDRLTKDITYGGEPNLTIGHRFRDAGFKDGAVDEFQIYERALTANEFKHLAGKPSQSDAAYELSQAESVKAAREELRTVRKEFTKFINNIPDVMVMDELPNPKPAFILNRGAYDSPGTPVTADTPKVMPAFPQDLPRNRLGLARWLTLPDHPLTARVIVNRLWQQMFGQGLVETSDNFGTTGVPPTHPELLDWLARDFIAHGWDIQHTLRQIALTQAYAQGTKATPEALAKDPYNHLLARATSRRLTAEMLRDQALFTSGLLVEKIGGPSVYPYQPEGLWNEAMGRPHYPQSKGEGLYRRSLYTVWKRTAPHPQMATFDAADRSVCSARRQATNTPLQALALLNDPQMVEAARLLAERVMDQPEADRVVSIFRLATSRMPSPRETSILRKLHEEQLAEYRAKPAEAEKLLKVGEKPANPKRDPATLAATTIVALTVLNHGEAVTR